MDSRTLAARNNAAWCDLVCRSHGLRTEWTDDAWMCLDPPPALYPQMVTLRPQATEPILRHRPVAVKDAFAARDVLLGYECLLTGKWWIHDGPLAGTAPFLVIQTPADLEMWRGHWDGPSGTFPDSLLQDSNVRFISARDDGWGGVLNQFEGSVGITNVFGDLNRAYRGLLGASRRWLPGSRVCLWEPDEVSAPLIEAGFVTLGPLRVWIRQDSA